MSDPSNGPPPDPPPVPPQKPVQFQYAGATPVHPAVHLVRPRGAFAQLFFDLIWMAAAAFVVAVITVAIVFGGQLWKAGITGVVIACVVALIVALAWATFVDRLRAAAAERTISLIEQAVRSGMPLPNFLRTAASTEPFLVARGLRTIHTLLHHGLPLSAAFAKAYPRVPGWVIDSLDLPPGGSLSRSIADLRTRQRREHATQMLTLGPARGRIFVTIIAILFVVSIAGSYIFPSFEKIMRDFGVRSEWMIAWGKLYSFGNLDVTPLLLLAAGVLLLIWVARALAVVASARYGAPASFRGPISRSAGELFDRIAWGLPLVGAHQRDVAWADFFGRLANHVVAAEPLPRAVQSSAMASPSRGVATSAGVIAAKLQAGSTLAAAFEAAPGVPQIAAGLLASARTTGQVASVARVLSDRFGERAVRRAEFVRSIVPVVVTLVLAAITLYLVLMIFVPFTELINASVPAQFKVTP